MTIPPAIRTLLACPACHGPLSDVESGAVAGEIPPSAVVIIALDCPACGLRYPVRDGIPVLLADQAEPR